MPHRRIAKIELKAELASRAVGVEARVITLAGVSAQASVGSEQISKTIDLKKFENKLNKNLVRVEICDQRSVDEQLLSLKSKTTDLTGVATLATSIAVARVAAKVSGHKLYEHLRDSCLFAGHGWRSPSLIVTLAESEGQRLLLVIPVGTKKISLVDQAIEIGLSVFTKLGRSSERVRSMGSGPYGGYRVNAVIDRVLWSQVVRIIKKQKLQLGKDVYLGLDLNGQSIYDKKNDRYFLGDGPALTQGELIHWSRLVGKEFAIHLLIDPLAGITWSDWEKFSVETIKSQLLVASRNIAGRQKILSEGLGGGAIEAVSFSLNENTTLTDAVQLLMSAKHSGVGRICRIGLNESIDSVLVDLAFASRSEFLDIGGPLGSEHTTKYNRLLTIARKENI